MRETSILTGKRIANLGVNGYGLDQAVLKFEKYGARHPARVAILGLYPHEYRRALARPRLLGGTLEAPSRVGGTDGAGL